jgi:hypothetical protein
MGDDEDEDEKDNAEGTKLKKKIDGEKYDEEEKER